MVKKKWPKRTHVHILSTHTRTHAQKKQIIVTHLICRYVCVCMFLVSLETSTHFTQHQTKHFYNFVFLAVVVVLCSSTYSLVTTCHIFMSNSSYFQIFHCACAVSKLVIELNKAYSHIKPFVVLVVYCVCSPFHPQHLLHQSGSLFQALKCRIVYGGGVLRGLRFVYYFNHNCDCTIGLDLTMIMPLRRTSQRDGARVNDNAQCGDKLS